MRLSQLEGKDPIGKSVKADKPKSPDKETIEILKDLEKEMHVAMMQADLVLRRLAQILDKY